MMKNGTDYMNWINSGRVNSFVEYVHIFLDEVVTTFQSSALIAYSLQGVVINAAIRGDLCLFKSGLTLVGLMNGTLGRDGESEGQELTQSTLLYNN